MLALNNYSEIHVSVLNSVLSTTKMWF